MISEDIFQKMFYSASVAYAPKPQKKERGREGVVYQISFTSSKNRL